jgi:hypothetical protein
MVDKRGHEDVGTPDPEAKKARVEGDGAPGASRVSAEMLEKLEKTKRLLQAQKELQEKLKKLPQARSAAPAAVPLPLLVLPSAAPFA